MRYLLLSTLLAFLVNNAVAQPPADETHLREAGTGIICLRSAFAHGYRHGYEEGYHLGNIDINMGRHPRARRAEFRGISSRYSSEFGPGKSFEAGFQEGLKAGYYDGFAGRTFRAVESLRIISNALAPNPTSADPTNAYFDQGISAGYNHGFDQAQQDIRLPDQRDLDLAGCAQFHPVVQQEVAAQGSFCDGYRRGYMLGREDGIVLSPEVRALAARR